MNINIISVGKIKESYYREALAEFEKRLSRFCTFGSVILPDKSIPDNPTAGECEDILRREGEQILNKTGKSDFVVAMCIEGKQLASEDFAQKMQDIMMQHSTVDFVIGGSLGLSDAVKERADFKFSLSKMTFPHRIARLVLTEQVYRAFKIMANETYHK